MLLAWLISIILLVVFITFPIMNWIEKGEKRKGLRIVLSVIAIFVFFTFIVLSLFTFNPHYSNGTQESVTITHIDEVYKSNVTRESDSCYYVSKLSDESICEIKVNTVSTGSSNFVITKKYKNGNISNELVVTDKENIPTLKNFNN